MYTPSAFKLEDLDAAASIMNEYGFALLVTAAGGTPVATHLPFLFDPARGERGTLLGHMARANPQWRSFGELASTRQEALVAFSGAHGYISPSWYGAGPAVPTWNYQAVHAYGIPRVIHDRESVHALVGALVTRHESGFEAPWSLDSQEGDYLDKMVRGIVAFEIPVVRLEAKAKLSQNRSAGDRAGVIAGLERSTGAGDQELAGVMAGSTASG